MNSEQIECILSKDSHVSPVFRDVYPINRLPPIRNGAFVVNTATSDHPGLHWVAAWVRDDVIEYFDSYALQPSAKLYRWGRGNQWVCNPMALQRTLSAVCGQYCIYFLLHPARGIPMRIVLNDFGPNVDENDKLVFDFVQRSFDYDGLTLLNTDLVVRHLWQSLVW